MDPLPHVLNFQEVVGDTRPMLIKAFSSHYIDCSDLTDRQAHALNREFIMMFVRKDVNYVFGARSAFLCGTSQGVRDYLFAQIVINNRTVSIYSSHLDSCRSKQEYIQKRREQVCVISALSYNTRTPSPFLQSSILSHYLIQFHPSICQCDMLIQFYELHRAAVKSTDAAIIIGDLNLGFSQIANGELVILLYVSCSVQA